MNTRTTSRRTNETLVSQCYACGTAANTRMFVNNLCPSCHAPTAPEITLEATCDRIVDNNPISGTQALITAPTKPTVPPEHSTRTARCTGNSAAGTGNLRTGTYVGSTGSADTTLAMVESRSPVRNNDIPKECDLHALAAAGPSSVPGSTVPDQDSPRTAFAARTGNPLCTTLPGVTLGTQTTSQNVPVTVHPAREGDIRMGVYIPNDQHRRCTCTPRKQPYTD
jgi:hypothetical protein